MRNLRRTACWLDRKARAVFSSASVVSDLGLVVGVEVEVEVGVEVEGEVDVALGVVVE